MQKKLEKDNLASDCVWSVLVFDFACSLSRSDLVNDVITEYKLSTNGENLKLDVTLKGPFLRDGDISNKLYVWLQRDLESNATGESIQVLYYY